MRFYSRQHRHYCGIDRHVKTVCVCILDAAGLVLVHRNVQSTPEAFLEIVAPYRDDLVAAADVEARPLPRVWRQLTRMGDGARHEETGMRARMSF